MFCYKKGIPSNTLNKEIDLMTLTAKKNENSVLISFKNKLHAFKLFLESNTINASSDRSTNFISVSIHSRLDSYKR